MESGSFDLLYVVFLSAISWSIFIQPTLIFALFFNFQPEEASKWRCFPKPGECPIGFEAGTFQFDHNVSTHYATFHCFTLGCSLHLWVFHTALHRMLLSCLVFSFRNWHVRLFVLLLNHVASLSLSFNCCFDVLGPQSLRARLDPWSRLSTYWGVNRERSGSNCNALIH